MLKRYRDRAPSRCRPLERLALRTLPCCRAARTTLTQMGTWHLTREIPCFRAQGRHLLGTRPQLPGFACLRNAFNVVPGLTSKGLWDPLGRVRFFFTRLTCSMQSGLRMVAKPKRPLKNRVGQHNRGPDGIEAALCARSCARFGSDVLVAPSSRTYACTLEVLRKPSCLASGRDKGQLRASLSSCSRRSYSHLLMLRRRRPSRHQRICVQPKFTGARIPSMAGAALAVGRRERVPCVSSAPCRGQEQLEHRVGSCPSCGTPAATVRFIAPWRAEALSVPAGSPSRQSEKLPMRCQHHPRAPLAITATRTSAR